MAEDSSTSRGRSRFSFRRMAVCGVLLALASVVAVCLTGAVIAVYDMQHEADVTLAAAQPRIEDRIDETFKLLETLSEHPTLSDPDVDVMEKVNLVDAVNEHFGFFLLCYVDEDINVWDATGAASLASRSHMQRVYSTGQRYVTDSFVAGADGTTLNYTIIVPLRDEQGAMTGSVFASIYFDEIMAMLDDSLASSYVKSLVIGGKGQVMSATSGFVYDDPFLDPIRDSIAFGMTADTVQSELLALNPVSFWTVNGLDVKYYTVAPIAETEWDAVCVTSFWEAYSKVMWAISPLALVAVVLIATAFLIIRRSFMRQMQEARTLERSVSELQKKLYSDDQPADAGIADILELTSSGLSDGLTGTMTRSVFASRLQNVLENADDGIYALCFIDLDDFKHVNDTFGHATGDVALKSVGYLLREYERRYDGLVGRYGGDEFTLLMTDFDDRSELYRVLEELTSSLHADVQTTGSAFSVHCSVGVSVWDHQASADELMKQADSALYRVKQRGKESFCIYQDEERS
ncbi:GGDEF domain-containing protein [Enteroscipio rubneri]|uniref:GGDEF domain-containing protein n=1 Tax=Enteroscipio rubneri TaxID=2070686 RepID=A0A2K2UD72_9ACTN|nr:GGDEF domain-containing protein [Enteroscipio rubneri]PNV68281.1 GGDEF domain-containing protein [Enteroscipio rubneri]